MFYNPAYLKKKEKYGLIWLAATQTKLLSRREIVSIDLPTVCEDIASHIWAERRFSLCLSSHLIYGTVKILNKQWDYLLMDLQELWIKSKFIFTLLSSSTVIDMVPLKKRHVLDSNVPSNERDAKYDQFFGAYKEPIIDIESMLTHLESLSEERGVLVIAPVPNPVVPEIGSPHSVSDPKEIQIREVEMSPSVVPIPGEKDLPKMDSNNMMSFLSVNQDEAIKELEQAGPNTSIHEGGDHVLNESLVHDRTMSDILPQDQDPKVTAVRDVLIDAMPQTNISMQHQALPPLQETPLTKSANAMPDAPQKPRAERKQKPRDPTKKDSRFREICNEEKRPEAVSEVEGEKTRPTQTSSDDSFLMRQQQQMEKEADERGHGHDWALKNTPPIELSPLPQPQSPLRKKRHHRLIVNQVKEMTVGDLKQNQRTRDDIITPMTLPETSLVRNVYKEPYCKYLRSKALDDLFLQNCNFGLRMDDTGSEMDFLPYPRVNEFLSRKRARGANVDETPANKLPRRSGSEVASIERARAGLSGLLSESVGRNMSQSSVGQMREESPNLSKSSLRGRHSLSEHDTSKESMLDRDVTLSTALAPWPEERELVVSPVKIVPEIPPQNELEIGEVAQATIPEENVQLNGENSFHVHQEPLGNETIWESDYSPRTEIFKLVENGLRLRNDWTTFDAICPKTLSRKKAASMFHALLVQISRGKLSVRQAEPYETIFVWVRNTESSATSSSD